jgi:hypothetical protein
VLDTGKTLQSMSYFFSQIWFINFVLQGIRVVVDNYLAPADISCYESQWFTIISKAHVQVLFGGF